MASVESRVKALEAKISTLEQIVEKQAARCELANLMSRHQFLQLAGRGKQIVSDLWCDDTGCSIEIGASGVFRGLRNVYAYYDKDIVPGMMSLYALTTPNIHLSGDASTAIGNWIAIGTETDAGELGTVPPTKKDRRKQLLSSVDTNGKRYRAEWLWQRYCVCFHKTLYGWKIHDMHISEYFKCPFDSDWVQFSSQRFQTDGIWLESLMDGNVEFPSGEHNPDGPSTYHWQYRTDSSVDGIHVGL